MNGPRPTSGLRGREAERDLLRNAINRAVHGQLSIAIVEGEAGIGKTTLLEDATASARTRDITVLAAGAYELERTRPFGMLLDALDLVPTSSDPRRAAIAGLLSPTADDPEPISVSSDEGLRFRAVDAIIDLVEALAEQAPLVLALDDLQWADPTSMLTITAIAHRLPHSPIAILCCARPIPRSAELDQAITMFEGAAARRVVLGRLSDDAVTEIVTDTVGAPPGENLMAEVAGAGGNPLFITELLAATLHDQAVHTVNGVAELGGASLPPSLRLTLLRRISYLPEETLRILRSAAILGSRFSLTDLSIITTQPALELFTALGPALDARVIAGDGHQLRFRHDLLHDALYGDVPEAVRMALHREAAQLLTQSGAPDLQVAAHWTRVATARDPDAIQCLTRAARQVALTSPASAVEFFQHAVELLDASATDHDRLVVEQAVAMMRAGRIEDAETSCRLVLTRSQRDPKVTASARTCLAHALIAQGQMAHALEQLQRLTESPAVTDAERAAAWGWTGMARLSLAQLDEAATAATHARTLAIASDEYFITSLAITSQAMVQELRADPSAALKIIDEAVSRADASPNRVGHRYPIHVTRGHILLELDRLSDAAATLEAGMRVSEELGVRWPLPSFHVFLALTRYLQGSWDDCDTNLDAALELAAETGERYSLVIGHAVMANLALHRGELASAARATAAAENELASHGRRYRSHWAQWARALLQEANGDTTGAFAALDGCWQHCVDTGLIGEYSVLGPDLVRLALAAGHHDRAEDVAAALNRSLSDSSVHSLTGAALRCQGVLVEDPQMLLDSAQHYTSAGRPLESAQAMADAGTLLAGRDPDAAIPQLRQAAAEFNRLTARRDQARCQAVLRGLGVRSGVRGTRTRTRHGWESLTTTERDVITLVTQGLSNPEIGAQLFISRRTVQSHLSHIFAKLNVSSRAQLAADATRR